MGRPVNDLSGLKIGKLLVKKLIGRKPYGENIWRCICDCGKTVDLIHRSVTKRDLPNCGCLNSRLKQESPYWKGHGDISHELYNLMKRNAETKGFKFNVSIKYLWDLFLKQNKKCVFTKIELYFNPSSKELKNRIASLDRIDSRKGYIKGNLQWVHRLVNKIKKNVDDDQFIKICHLVSKNTTEPNVKITANYFTENKGKKS
jgi:hypothetical protein